jgi:hypothetical protein
MLVDSIFLLYTFVQEKICKIRYVESYVSSIAVMPDIMDIHCMYSNYYHASSLYY